AIVNEARDEMAAALVLGDVELVRVAAVEVDLQAHLLEPGPHPELGPQVLARFVEVVRQIFALLREELGPLDQMLLSLSARQAAILAEEIGDVAVLLVLAGPDKDAIAVRIVLHGVAGPGSLQFVDEFLRELLTGRLATLQKIEETHGPSLPGTLSAQQK